MSYVEDKQYEVVPDEECNYEILRYEDVKASFQIRRGRYYSDRSNSGSSEYRESMDLYSEASLNLDCDTSGSGEQCKLQQKKKTKKRKEQSKVTNCNKAKRMTLEGFVHLHRKSSTY